MVSSPKVCAINIVLPLASKGLNIFVTSSGTGIMPGGSLRRGKSSEQPGGASPWPGKFAPRAMGLLGMKIYGKYIAQRFANGGRPGAGIDQTLSEENVTSVEFNL